MDSKSWKFVYAFVTIVILAIQTKIMIDQNRLVEIQNRLSESNRESSYSAELFNIISLVGQETNKYSYIADSIDEVNWRNLFDSKFDILNCNPDTTRKILSPVLSNRISSFTQYVEPYSIIELSGSLSRQLYSPERKKLFKYLIFSYADLRNMLFNSDFSHLYLTDFRISNRYLRGLNISNSFMSDNVFYKTELSATKYSNSILINTSFTNCKLIPADFQNVVFDSVSFDNTYLPYPVHFKGACIKYIDLTNALVPGKDWLTEMKAELKECGNIDDYTIEELPTDTLNENVINDIYFYRIIKKNNSNH